MKCIINAIIVDYIFFIKTNVTLHANPNEVSNVKYVTQDELRAMMNNSGKFGMTRHDRIGG